MPVDTTRFPYSSIVYVTDTIGTSNFHASGVLISPDEVLTASHVVWSTGIGTAVSIEVSPGYNSPTAPFGTVAGTIAHYNQIDDTNDKLFATGIENDYAIIHLAHPVSAGVMSLGPDFRGGKVNVTGYPGTTGALVDSVQTVALEQAYTIFNGSALGPGSSGGPVWLDMPFNQGVEEPTVVGIVSAENTSTGTGFFPQITSAIYGQIRAWVAQDDAGLPSQYASNPLVSAAWYDGTYADVVTAPFSAAYHYAAYGWHEGRDPDPFFSTSGYLGANPDVRAANIDPAAHYDQTGWKEGRDPSAGFDTRLYLEHNPDVAAAGLDPLEHFLDFGQFEGRSIYPAIGPSSMIAGGFDRESYELSNPDVARLGIDPLTHWELYGWHENRNPDPFFNTAYYLAQNPDVVAAGINPLTHYDLYGWHENRDPSANFSTSAYLANAPDVKAAGLDPLQHYLQYGIYEGRVTV